ncbi:hypothetical protein FD754_002650 [Muntiacus muntjak]|uniref:Uncharacterized protein n=1 Tax=Muntiacus muntjak TaxID=9888 RepID=A0A5N3WAK7_MUNMU|nr:hypothetical protein FD754_002650 [Muntiacus muntjak]
MATPNPTNAHPTLGAWAPYPLYTVELTPAISHTAVHLPSRHRCCRRPACSGALVQFSSVRWYLSSDITQPGWKYRHFC